MRAIADALSVNKALSELYIYKIGINDEGAVAVADALLVNKTVRILGLPSNRIGLVGRKALLNMIKENTSLYDLRLEPSWYG